MATVATAPATVARAPPRAAAVSLAPATRARVSFRRRSLFAPARVASVALSGISPLRFAGFVPFAAADDVGATETEEEVVEPQVEGDADGAVVSEDGAAADEITDTEEKAASAVLISLQSYKEALASNDESKVAEIEAFLKSIEDEKSALESKVSRLSAELSVERDRILRISADFENFRRRTERERLSLVTNAQGEVVENLLPVLDNFERAKAQIKVETEGEEKINNSYQNISKQFIEILGSLGVVPVETVGTPFDPLLHEAIMREESTEYEEGIILQEFRKGFKLGERLLRPSMVKVSAGPGPAKPEAAPATEEESNDAEEVPVEGSAETESG
ncbi:protein GrpE isoform X1 [Eucalyptus grandis]|uniref:Uncharacterized protein n=2 Tax=Eucalyptus grandis TaxID=71139 RepID=A0ACC3IVS0_EUCGR|nr:protein GrpE isoform X1 [Eucalyptus grandis]KAK3405295.1 hypothetical protein EUGRSUZ_K01549 [Eucalyptus grandis]